MKNKSSRAGFVHLIIIIIVAFLLMRYFNITITGIADWVAQYLPSRVVDLFETFFNWFAGLVSSVW